jgi:hypothetical protein
MSRVSLVPLVLAIMGCYHTTVETGAAPSEQVIERCCEAGFLGGLVAPKAVQSEAACPNGVARVETSRSFSNVVFTVLTAGLYSPMSVRITCASAQAVAAAQEPVPPAAVRADSSGRAVP